MKKTLATNTVIYGTKPQEMDMRDIMGSMEELASMIGIRASTYTCEILAIEPPYISGHQHCYNAGNPHKRHLKSAKSQVLPFQKK